MQRSVYEWNVGDVATWLDENELSDYKVLLCDKHKIDGGVLISLTEDDFRKPLLEITIIGDLKRICRCIDKLRVSYSVLNGGKRFYDVHEAVHKNKERTKNRFGWLKHVMLSEKFRTSCSGVYGIVVFFLTLYMTTYVHERLPDKSSHPPLPDIVLDNMPLMTSAFRLSNYCCTALSLLLIAVMVFHKHRLTIMRRSCAIQASIFLLRNLTMYVTSLSVPGKHLECYPIKYGTVGDRLKWIFGNVVDIIKFREVTTCGDYMFSGHAAYLTLLHFSITEYTPRRWYLLRIACWIFNLAGIYFILAAHEHYTADVVISFYITVRLFQSYHTLASSIHVQQSDQKRRSVWYPLFCFFEYGTPLVIPNEFECPFAIPRISKLLSFWHTEKQKDA